MCIIINMKDVSKRVSPTPKAVNIFFFGSPCSSFGRDLSALSGGILRFSLIGKDCLQVYTCYIQGNMKTMRLKNSDDNEFLRLL